MASSLVRLRPSLIAAAAREGMGQDRSTPEQIEFWVDFGRAVEDVIDFADYRYRDRDRYRKDIHNIFDTDPDSDPEKSFDKLQTLS